MEKKIKNKHILHVTFYGELRNVIRSFWPLPHFFQTTKIYLEFDFRYVCCYLGFVQMLSEITRFVYKLSYLNYLQIHFQFADPHFRTGKKILNVMVLLAIASYCFIVFVMQHNDFKQKSCFSTLYPAYEKGKHCKFLFVIKNILQFI